MALTQTLGSNLAAKFGSIQSYSPVGAQIYGGATVVVRLTDGKIYPAVDDTADTHKQLVLGIALEDAAVGASVRVRQDGKFKRQLTGSPSNVIGRLACVYDDETVQLYDVAGCKVVVGRITEWPTSIEVFVNLEDRPVRLAVTEHD